MKPFGRQVVFSALLVCLGVLEQSTGQTVFDINTRPNSGSPYGFVAAGGAVYFTAENPFRLPTNIDRRIWWMNGGQPELVTDSPRNPVALFDLDGVALGIGETGPVGRELFRLDDGVATPVTDINPGSYHAFDTSPDWYTFEGFAYFGADDDENGVELWRSDGVTYEMVADLNPGTDQVGHPAVTEPRSSSPADFADIDGFLYFRAADVSHGAELWRIDGYGLIQRYDLIEGFEGSYPQRLYRFGEYIYFNAADSVWRMKGTAPPEVMTGVVLGNRLLVYNDLLWHAVKTAEYGWELWKFDGNESTIVADINSGPGNGIESSTASAVFDGYLYFAADDGLHGMELWRTDGTTTEVFEDIAEGPDSADPRNLVATPDHLYFIANNLSYRTDGTSVERTTTNGWVGSYLDGTIYGAARDTDGGSELWIYDGANSTIHDLWPGNESGNPRDFIVLGDYLYFTAETREHGEVLYRTDGVTVNRVVGESNYREPRYPVVFDGHLYFSAVGDIWKVTGLEAAIAIDYGPGARPPERLTSWAGHIYYVAFDASTGRALWRTDGTTVELVVDIDPATTDDPAWQPWFLMPGDDYLFFNAFTRDDGRTIWRTDGATTAPVPSWTGDRPTEPNQPVLLNQQLFYSATRPDLGEELWRTDGVNQYLVSDIYPGAESSRPRDLAAIGQSVYVTANNGVDDYQMWRADTLGAVRVGAVADRGLVGPGDFVEFKGDVFFTANDPASATRLWKLKDEIVYPIADTAPYWPAELTVFGDDIYYRVENDEAGTELWRTNGFVGQLAYDLYEGPGSGSPFGFVEYDDRLYFNAGHALFGREVFAIDPVDHTLDEGPTTSGDAGVTVAVYPNPVGTSATLQVTGLPVGADVRIAVFDVLGRRVATVFDGATPRVASRWPVDAARLGAGVYFAQVYIDPTTSRPKILTTAFLVTR